MLKRYDQTSPIHIEECEDGYWVKASEAEAALAEREIEITLQKNRIERLEQLARDLDAKLTEAESLERKTNEIV